MITGETVLIQLYAWHPMSQNLSFSDERLAGSKANLVFSQHCFLSNSFCFEYVASEEIGHPKMSSFFFFFFQFNIRERAAVDGKVFFE